MAGSRTALVVLHEPELGGASRAMLRVVPLLEQRGWDFSFWVPGDGAASEELVRRGYDVAGERRLIPFSIRSLREPPGALARLADAAPYLRAFARRLGGVRPALVHANTLLTLPELLLARAAGYPTLLYGHEMLPPRLKGAATAAAARMAARSVLTVCEASRRELRARFVPARVVHGGVPMPPPPTALEPARERRPVIGMVGVVSRRKGADVFLAAVREARRRGSDADWRLIGPTPEGHLEGWARAQLEEAARLGVRYLPRVPDVFAELAAWDVFVLPARSDPFPIALLEAMASGLPVVATAVGGIPEQVTPATGVLVPPGDPVAVADAVLTLSADPARRERLGRAARERVERLFPLERQAAGLDRAYRELVDGRGE